MTAKTNYLEDAVLNHVLRNVAYTSPAGVYIALFTSNPGEGGTQTSEVSGGSYARQACTFGAPASNIVANTAAVTFPQATGSWGTITHVGIMDASSAGNMLYYGALGTPKTVGTSDQVSFAIGALTVGED